jgi:predicted MFS family arabinose efflux permease
MIARPSTDVHVTTGVSPPLAAYTVFMLLIVHVISHIDRSILGILLEPIKADLGYSDTQLGFLSGIAFALFYATLGIPAAWLADRSNRRNFVAIACAFWSVMTALCGAAQNFVQLALARVGVAVGESGAGPASVSIISSLYARERRARALAVYAMAASIGVLVGHPIGGTIADTWGWRYAFVAVAAPGVLIALIVRFTVPEPHRQITTTKQDETQSMRAALAFILRSKACRYLMFGAAISAFLNYGLGSWVPAYLMRSHDMSASGVGLNVSPITGVCGMIGGLLGGQLADRLGARNPVWTARMITIAKLIAFPMLVGFFLIPTLKSALFAYFLAVFFGAVYLGPTYAMIQSVVPVTMRATAAAVQLLIINLIGLGLGPQLVGVLSDALRAEYGNESLRIALAVFATAHIPGALLYWIGGKHYRDEVAKQET